MKSLPVKVPAFPSELAQALGEPPLAINEKREDYNKLLDAIAGAVKPRDAIAWIYVRDIVDLLWEIRREKTRKMKMIVDGQIVAVANLLTPSRERGLDPFGSDKAFLTAMHWAEHERVRAFVDRMLLEEDRGIDANDILSLALTGADIDDVDKRIASYQARYLRMIRELEQYNEKMARRLEKAAMDVVEGEFAEAAE